MTDALNDKQKRGDPRDRVRRAGSGRGADIAAAWSISPADEAAYVTGQTLHVNGGMAMI